VHGSGGGVHGGMTGGVQGGGGGGHGIVTVAVQVGFVAIPGTMNVSVTV